MSGQIDPTHVFHAPTDATCTLCNVERASPQMADVCVGTAAEPAAPVSWTLSEIATLRQGIKDGLSASQIGLLLNRSRCSIGSKARALRLTLPGTPGGSRPSRAAEQDAIAAELRAGKSIAGIARERRIDHEFVRRIRNDLGLAQDRQPAREQATALLRAGGKICEVARACRISRPALRAMRDELGIAPVKPRPFTRKPKPDAKPRPSRAKPVVVAPVPERVVLQPAPIEARGKPGVWGIPIGRTLEQIEVIAAGMAYPYGGLHDLPWFNKHRVAQGYAPLCVNFPKRDVPLPSRLRSRMI